MAETNPNPNPNQKTRNAAEAAKLVKVKPSDVLAHADYGTHVVVVTTDGRKLSTADAVDGNA